MMFGNQKKNCVCVLTILFLKHKRKNYKINSTKNPYYQKKLKINFELQNLFFENKK